MLSAESMTISKTELEVMVGNASNLPLTVTYRDGHTANVAAEAIYEISGDVVTIKNGQVRGLKEGIANVKGTYTDPLGHTLTVNFTVRSTFFPFSAEYISTSLFAQGTYNESTHTFKPGQWGQMGWEYQGGADMSGYKYLVIKLAETSSGSHLNIFTEGSIWSPCYSTSDFGSKKQIVINLQVAKYTSDSDKKGQPLDTKNIRIVSFWGTGSQSIKVSDMYLTNNSDYSREESSSINFVQMDASQTVDVWSLTGQRIRQAVDIRQATYGLPKGIYIIGNKKVIVK